MNGSQCPAWCVDHDRPDRLGLPILHFGVPTAEAKDGPYLFQEGDGAPMVGLHERHLTIDEAERLSAALAAVVTASRR